MKHLLKTDNGKLVIYLDAPDWDGAPAAAFGDFTCKSLEAGCDLLRDGIAYTKSQGINRIIGPMSGDTWHSYRFVTESDGSNPFMMEPKNQQHELDAFLETGFKEISSYFSARATLDDAAKTKPDETDAFSIETWDGSDPEKLFKQVFDLSVTAFSKNAFFKPISEQDFLAMYMPVVPMLKNELILFARRPDGSLAGFLFGIPNYSEGPQTKTAILKTYASLERGAGRHLSYHFHKNARDAGFETAIHALIHKDNQSANRSTVEGGTVFRRYGLFGLRLDG